jgi:hypothetical protein
MKDLCTDCEARGTDPGRDKKPGAPLLASVARSGMRCDKNDDRGMLAGGEGVSGKKPVDSETMTVKTKPSLADCHPEAAESRAQASDSQRRISVLIAEHEGLIQAETKTGCPTSRVCCEKWDAVR